jgi:hypothetical protein
MLFLSTLFVNIHLSILPVAYLITMKSQIFRLSVCAVVIVLNKILTESWKALKFLRTMYDTCVFILETQEQCEIFQNILSLHLQSFDWFAAALHASLF